MGSITSQNKKRDRQLKERKKEEKEREANFPKNRIMPLVFCALCGSVAYCFATRKDNNKKVPLCSVCAPSTVKNAPWILSMEKI